MPYACHIFYCVSPVFTALPDNGSMEQVLFAKPNRLWIIFVYYFTLIYLTRDFLIKWFGIKKERKYNYCGNI